GRSHPRRHRDPRDARQAGHRQPVGDIRGHPCRPYCPKVRRSGAAVLRPAPADEVSAPVLASKLDLESPEAKARGAHNRALAEELRAKVAMAALGGPEKSRQRHTERGKLLPRERVERLL